MIKEFLSKLGASDRGLLKVLADLMRIPIRIAQLHLLNLHKDEHVVRLIKEVAKERRCFMWPTEMAQVYHCASLAKKLPGDFAEIGVYKGGSAKLICEAKGNKWLHLFDTFEGLPRTTFVDDTTMREKMYHEAVDSVKKFLSGYRNVIFYKGFFPETTKPVRDKMFAFVHMDVDLYGSTLACLNFFYPRMVRGGVMLSHDYSTLIGVKKAFDEFFADKPESVIELSTSQCMIVKNLPSKEKS